MKPIEYDIRALYQADKASAQSFSAERLILAKRELITLKTILGEMGRELPTRGLFLDLGCGDRFLASAVQSQGLQYIGLDADTLNFETDTLPFDDASIDLAVSLAVIEHLRDPSRFLAEIRRCLKPGGAIYLSTPNFQYDFRNFYNDPTHRQPYTPTSLEALLNLFGYEDVATFPGLRCKSPRWYRGKSRFWRAYHLLPFRGDTRWAPEFLKGHARSIFGLGFKAT